MSAQRDTSAERGTVLAQTEPKSGHCKVLSDARNAPKFSCRLLITGSPPANALLTIAVNGVVSGIEEAVSLGYGALPLFAALGDESLTAPSTPHDGPIALRTGCFQLPLHLGSELALGPPCLALVCWTRRGAQAE